MSSFEWFLFLIPTKGGVDSMLAGMWNECQCYRLYVSIKFSVTTRVKRLFTWFLKRDKHGPDSLNIDIPK